MRKSTWNTYRTTGYTHDVANDQRSAGGVHHHQVRLAPSGAWQYRILQTNGRHRSIGVASVIDAAIGEANFAMAEAE